jgi:DNA-binding transcriptional ArsR family regulator
MVGVASIAEVAALIGDPARANMLFALKDDGRLSAGDLAAVAGVAPSTASEHLAKLSQAGLVQMTVKGRKRYYCLGEPSVSDVLEGVQGLTAMLWRRNPKPLRWDQATVHARSCLDHLAGRLGGQMAGAAMAKGFISHSPKGPDLTEEGAAWLGAFGVNADALRVEPRRFIRLCPDWMEETPHIGGSVGAALLNALVEFGWLRRVPRSRNVLVTPKGAAGFRVQLDFDVRASDA